MAGHEEKKSSGRGEKAKGARAEGGVNTLEKHGLLFFLGKRKAPQERVRSFSGGVSQ